MTFAKAVATHLAQKQGLREVVGNLVKASFYIMIVGSLQYLTLTRSKYYLYFEFNKLIYAKCEQ